MAHPLFMTTSKVTLRIFSLSHFRSVSEYFRASSILFFGVTYIFAHVT